MALAWKASWVHALAGSNPASSAALTSGNAVVHCSAPRAAETFSLSFSPRWPRFGLIWAVFGDVSGRRRTPTDAPTAGFDEAHTAKASTMASGGVPGCRPAFAVATTTASTVRRASAMSRIELN
jgi:hypothetical protein